MRSRLWALILRELPFPFREIGTEVVRLLTWIDTTAAKIWIGFSRSPAWYVVMTTGTLAVLMTTLLFSTFVATHDPTLGELAKRSKAFVPATRETLEDAGDWAAQDKWRLAHFFVDHRPPKRFVDPHIDSSLVDDFPASSLPARLTPRPGTNSRFEPWEPLANIVLPEHDVRLDLGPPRVAEEPKRLVYGKYVREAGSNINPTRLASSYRQRDNLLLVQAEWSFASDCDSDLPAWPVGRIRPVPQPPVDDLPMVERDSGHPDLGANITMLREYLLAGEFPPHSRMHSVSAVSEFPESLLSHGRPDLFANDSSRWTRSSTDLVKRPPVEAYADRADEVPTDEIEREPQTKSAPSFTEVALRLELTAPESAIAGRANQSSLIVYNEGLREIPLLKVHEPLKELETVTDAIPPARVNRVENSLERRVEHLESGKDQQFQLIWRPETEGLRTHAALVTVQAVVGATTEVVAPVNEQPMPSVAPEEIPDREPEPEPAFEPQPVPEKNPSLSFDVQNRPRAIVDDLVEIDIVVTNTGDVPLHGVRVVAHLPQQLDHPQGSEVEYTIKSLPVRGSQKAVLRVVAQSTGHAVCRLVVAAEEPAEAKSKAVIDVDAKPTRPEAPKITKAEPPRPKTPPPPHVVPKRSSPTPASPPLNCCCQSVPMDFEPWFGP